MYMIPLAKPASRFNAVRLPIIFPRSTASGSLSKPGAKLLQQSIEPPFLRKKAVRTMALSCHVDELVNTTRTLKVNLRLLAVTRSERLA
jgi:hypothetical protein